MDAGRGTRRLTEQFIVHPNEIKTLRTGEAVVITKLRGRATRRVRVAPPRQTRRPTDPAGATAPARPPPPDLGR